MTRIITLFCIFIAQISFSQTAETYLEKIRNNEVELTAFFAQMPKGGDLHHHYSGSIYAEPLLAHAISEDFYLKTKLLQEQQKFRVRLALYFIHRKFSEIVGQGETKGNLTQPI